MTQGIFIEGIGRPKSKKQIKELAKTRPQNVHLEATSVFGNEPSGPITEVPDGQYYFVGPDPYKSRKFYGMVKKQGEKITIQ